MRHDDDPSVDDLREVFRIVQRCLDLWHDPAAWRAEFVAAVRGIVNAGEPGGFGVLQLVGPATATSDRPTLIHIATTPWPSRDAEDLYRRSMDPDERVELPGFAAAAAPAMRGGTAAFSRPMIVDERSWRESRFHSEFVRAMGLGDFAASITASPSVPALTLVCGYRPDGAPPIPMRVVKCLGILAEEFVPYLGTRLSLDDHANTTGLTPRQRQTLCLLLDGLSEKQIARELRISPATVHDYTVQLHRHFDVSSRGELLSYFVRRRPKPAPNR